MKKVKNIVGAVYLISIIGVILSPIVWIWLGWSLAWKVGLSSIIISIYFHKVLKFIEKEELNKDVNDITKIFRGEKIKKSKFQVRLEEAMERQKKEK